MSGERRTRERSCLLIKDRKTRRLEGAAIPSALAQAAEFVSWFISEGIRFARIILSDRGVVARANGEGDKQRKRLHFCYNFVIDREKRCCDCITNGLTGQLLLTILIHLFEGEKIGQPSRDYWG